MLVVFIVATTKITELSLFSGQSLQKKDHVKAGFG